MLDAARTDEITTVLGAKIASSKALGGGDINEAFAITLDDGRELFLKTNRRAPDRMFAAEARGLAWLAEPGVVRIPGVVTVSDRFLVLELVRPGTPKRTFDDDLGRALAALHRAGAPEFGLDHDNFIGRLPQSNRPAATWAVFYAEARLEPQVRRATDAGMLSPALRRGFGKLLAGLAGRVGPDEPPARLHGDLWGGNLMCDDRGQPCLIDPAVYGGHREVDLAMMRLFGGFSTSTFAAYEEAFPLAPEASERVDLYQLYPLLVHVNLFGGAYVSGLEAALSRLL